MDSLFSENLQLDYLMPLVRERLNAGQSVRFSPHGISMLPMLREGIDSIVLSPLPKQLHKFDLPLYVRDNGQYVLHRIVRAGDTYTCVGDNQFALEHGVRHDQMIALATAFYRGDRLIRFSSPLYRMYCRLWYYSRPARHMWLLGKRFLYNRLHRRPKR